MKNIHILPTDKPSIFYYNEIHKNYFINKKIKMPHLIEDENQNIYITSDEEIKEGDWYYDITLEQIIRANVNSDHNVYIGSCKKIILTTDQDLIADGVQAIDDEFLEWFVKNPSCEEVEFTRPKKCKVVGCDLECILFKTCENIYIGYKIIIPKEEPKQETLEEILERLSITDTKKLSIFLDGMMYQEKRSYSEEEVKNIVDETIEKFYKHFYTLTKAEMKERWFEQFKKK